MTIGTSGGGAVPAGGVLACIRANRSVGQRGRNTEMTLGVTGFQLDVEGVEIEAIKGGARLLQTDCVVICEEHGNDRH